MLEEMGQFIRIRIAIEPEQIDLNVGGIAIDEFAIAVQRKPRSVCVLVGVEKNVGAVILVVTFVISLAIGRSDRSIKETYSRAHR